MPAHDAISCDKLVKLIRTPKAPDILDVRRAAVRDADLRLIPDARMLAEDELTIGALTERAAARAGQSVVVVCASELLAASPGLSRIHNNDLEQHNAGMTPYHAFYRWARDATGATHNWPATAPET